MALWTLAAQVLLILAWVAGTARAARLVTSSREDRIPDLAAGIGDTMAPGPQRGAGSSHRLLELQGRTVRTVSRTSGSSRGMNSTTAKRPWYEQIGHVLTFAWFCVVVLAAAVLLALLALALLQLVLAALLGLILFPVKLAQGLDRARASSATFMTWAGGYVIFANVFCYPLGVVCDDEADNEDAWKDRLCCCCCCKRMATQAYHMETLQSMPWNPWLKYSGQLFRWDQERSDDATGASAGSGAPGREAHGK